MTADFLKPLDRYRQHALRFRQGDILDFAQHPQLRLADLTVVRSGSIEIFERAVGAGVTAYRPVTIFGPGAMFGVFDLMDRYCGIPPLTNKKEDWKIAAGRGATLLMATAPPKMIRQMYFDILGTERTDQKQKQFEPRDLLEAILPPEEVVLDLYKFDDIAVVMQSCPVSFDAIVRACWTSVQEYRRSRNHYTQSFYDAVMVPVIEDLGGSFLSTKKSDSVWARLQNVPGKDTLIPEIIYATIEAMERPALDNPMFFISKGPMRNRPNVTAKKDYDYLNFGTVLSARHPSQAKPDPLLSEEMYYPLGFQNLSINRFLDTRYDFSPTKGQPKLVTFFGPTLRKKGGSGSEVGMKDILDLVIASFKREYAERGLEYPFEVQAKFQAAGTDDRFVPLLVVTPKER